MSDEEKPSFKVNDRRGNESSDTTTNDTPKVSSNPKQTSEASITFASFLLSLSTSAMVHLGVRENPVTGKKEEDIEIAKQEIHLIELLKTKTTGNLDTDEARLLEDILFHLRMLFVEKQKK